MARIENSMFGQGIPTGDPPTFGVDPSDPHVAHADEHLKPLEAIAQQIVTTQPPASGGQPQMQPQPGMPGARPPALDHSHFITFQMGAPHIQQHLSMLENDPIEQAQYKQLKARFTKVVSIVQGAMQRISQAHQKSMATGQPLQQSSLQAALAGGGN